LLPEYAWVPLRSDRSARLKLPLSQFRAAEIARFPDRIDARRRAGAFHGGDTSDFDAVVLDLGFPSMSGIDVLRKWRDAGRSMPVPILTVRDLWSDKVARDRRGR
jgi:DNA-binding response OmpR family regulator